MSAEEKGRDDNSALVSRGRQELSTTAAALAKRGIELLASIGKAHAEILKPSREMQRAEARRHLDEARRHLPAFSQGPSIEFTAALLLSLEEGKQAFGAWSGAEGPDLVRRLFDDAKLPRRLDTVLDMEHDKAMTILADHYQVWWADVDIFLDNVERLIEPVSSTRSHTDVVMPQMGESLTEGTVIRWLKKVGDWVDHNEALFEISTHTFDAEIPSPTEGVLAEIRASEGQTVPWNSVVGVIGSRGVFFLPELGVNITVADVRRVLVKPGDTIEKEQGVVELETDLATIKVPSSVAGKVVGVKVKAGDRVNVGQAILFVGAEDIG